MTGGELERWVHDYVATYFWPADDISARGRKKARVLAQRAQALASLRTHAAELDTLRGDFGDETLVVFSTRVGDVELSSYARCSTRVPRPCACSRPRSGKMSRRTARRSDRSRSHAGVETGR